MSDQFGSRTVSSSSERDGSIFIALLAGVLAAIAGAAAWAIVDSLGRTEGVVPIGLMGIAVGAIVGFSIRLATNGRGTIFGVIGAVLAFAGCVGGEAAATIQRLTTTTNDFLTVARGVDFAQLISNILLHQKDYFLWIGFAIAAYEGYSFARHK